MDRADGALPDQLASERHTVRLTAAESQADILAALQLCAAGRLRCSEKTQRPSAATVGALTAALAAGDFYPDHAIAAYAWPLLLQAGGLAELAGGRLQLTGRGRAALTNDVPKTISLLWRRWLTSGVIDEMSRIEAIKGQRSTRALTAVKPRRKVIGEGLAACKPGEWVAVEELFARMRRRQPQPTVARDVWKLYLAEPQYGSLGYAGSHGWDLLEGRYLLCVLFEYAGTLGLFDLAYTDPAGAREDYRNNWGADDLDQLSRYDGLLAVRLNPLGANAFGLTPTYEPPAGPSAAGPELRVLPNLDVVVTGELRSVDQLLLDAYARRTADRVWSLSTASMLAALAAGRRPAELAQFLQGHSSNPLPATVTALIRDSSARSSRVRSLGVVHLVACSDPALTTLIAEDRVLRRLCSRVGELHLAVPVELEPDFRRGLQALGYVLSATVRD